MNEDKFTGKAEVYVKFRPTYPESFIDYLYSDVGFTANSAVADIGAGTGIFTKLLLERGSRLYAVEPNDDMRGAAKTSLAGFDGLELVAASAENTGLPGESLDFITVAQAFHWFDRMKFKDECARILKPGGKVVLVWNSRDSSSELVQENDELNHKFCPLFKGFSGGRRGESPEEFADFFKDGYCEYREFRSDITFDGQSFAGRNLSGSYAPKPGEENYEAFVDALNALFAKYAQNGIAVMPHITKSYIGEIF